MVHRIITTNASATVPIHFGTAAVW